MSHNSKTVMQNSEGRLYDLIAQRLLPDANKAEIDQRIWDLFGAEVNAACKLGEDVAKQGETLVTSAFQQACAAFAGVTYQKLEHAPAGTNSAYKVIFT